MPEKEINNIKIISNFEISKSKNKILFTKKIFVIIIFLVFVGFTSTSSEEVTASHFCNQGGDDSDDWGGSTGGFGTAGTGGFGGSGYNDFGDTSYGYDSPGFSSESYNQFA